MTAVEVSFAALVGACVGSFLNVVVYRVPRGESIMRPRSQCPVCGHPIRNLDNVPIVSWLVLQGRCRDCTAPISPRYVLIEAANAGLWVAAALRFARIEEAAFVALTCSVLLALAFIDLEHRRLPNVIVLPAAAVAAVWILVVAIGTSSFGIVRTGAIGGASFFLFLFLVALVSGGMGFGDVKLAGFIGLATGRFGWECTVLAAFAAFFAGGTAGVLLLATKRAGRKQAIPFGPAMAFGGILALFLGTGPVRAWLGL